VATWVLTGGIENFRINVERGFDLIGFKERRRRQAAEVEPGDEIVFYVTKYVGDDGEPAGQAFGAIARVTSDIFEDRTPIWPQGKKKYPEEYPWRVEAEPLLVLEEGEFVPAEALAGELEHTSRWPAEHWQLAFQGQLRTVSEKDAALLRGRIDAAAGAASGRR
jgi:predicted RNA-binding protein